MKNYKIPNKRAWQHTATAEARKLSRNCEKFGKKFRQIDARIFPLIEMLDFAILKGLYLKNRRKPLSVTFSDEITTPEESFQIGSRPSLPQHQKI